MRQTRPSMHLAAAGGRGAARRRPIGRGGPVRLSWCALALAVVLAACAGVNRTAQGSGARLDRRGLGSLIGREWPGDSTPVAGAEDRSGWLIEPGGDERPVYGMRVQSYRGRSLITAAREVGRRGSHALWRTTDAAWLPSLPAGSLLAIGCGIRDTLETGVFALVRNADTEWFVDVLRAWRLNAATGRIEPVSIPGLRCLNEGFGA